MIKKIREEAGLTMKEATELLGIPLRTWMKWESGERKPAPYLVKLIEFYINHKDLG